MPLFLYAPCISFNLNYNIIIQYENVLCKQKRTNLISRNISRFVLLYLIQNYEFPFLLSMQLLNRNRRESSYIRVGVVIRRGNNDVRIERNAKRFEIIPEIGNKAIIIEEYY